MNVKPAALAVTSLAIVVSFAADAPVAAQARDDAPRHAASRSAAPVPVEASLHPSMKRCGKKWRRAVQRLTESERAELSRAHHEIYRVAQRGNTFLVIELLSTPSLRSCDPTDLGLRQTTIRLTYHFPDGTSRIALHHFARDRVFFNRQPRIFVALGKALFAGIDEHGEESARWVPLPLLEKALQADPQEPVVIAGM